MEINHHLSASSDFSIGESLLQLEPMVKAMKAAGYQSVALMDTMSLHGVNSFTKFCKKEDIRPIVGCRIRVVADPLYRKPSKASGEKERPNPMFMLKVYVLEQIGIQSLFRLLTKANSEENFYYHSRVGIKDVLALKGVAVTTGDFYGMFGVKDLVKVTDTVGKALKQTFKDNFYVELCPANTPLFDTTNQRALAFAKEHEVQTIVGYPSLYKDDSYAPSLEVLQAVTTNTQMDSRFRPQQFLRDFTVEPPAKILDRLKAAVGRNPTHKELWVQGVGNIEKLAAKCEYIFAKMPVSLPKMAENEFLELGRQCMEGWKNRFSVPVLGYMPSAADIPVYQQRLKYELAVLKHMGFAGYFLLAADLVMWSKRNNIIVGPGRGSVGGSLVAYLVGITDVDPIRFNLMFERFINPERLDLPDADLDFMSSKRHLVVEYLTKKYGADRVAGISNYSSLASASALRDVGRVSGLSGLDLVATKLVPKEHGNSYNLTDAADMVPELDRMRADRPEMWKHALNLEGAMRSFGQHAAGIVVAGEPIVNRAAIEARTGTPVVNWDKNSVEDWGLVKMDLLGLSTLDVLEIARQYIKERHGVDVEYIRIPLEEPDVMEAFSKGETTGVFQFESGGMRKLLKDLAVGGMLTFEDIAAATALYRPGPMDSGMMDDYVQIRQGHKTPYYEHPSMEPVLSPTFGIIVYQEQVMQLAVHLAGFTGAQADHLRKAMGKKDMDAMAEQRMRWVNGCETTSGMDAGRAGELFDKIQAFAGYGFNRSHSVEYSIISMWTMWVRVRYPSEYFAASLSIVGEDKLAGLVRDARECGIEVLPPDVNESTHRFTINAKGELLAPFSSVKGVSENTSLKIMEMRDKQPGKRFDNMAQFLDAAAQKGSKVNTKVCSTLELVGAFANIEPSQLPARHLDRRRDQTMLMPGLILDVVKATRQTDAKDPFIRAKLIENVTDYRRCTACDLHANPHPSPRVANNVKYMVVFDSPSRDEERKERMMEGDGAQFVKDALKTAGLNAAEGYFTALVKSKKIDKFLSNDQINGCSKFLDREIEIIKPAVIVAMGSASIKRFVPGLKGGTADQVGKAYYDAKLDCTIVCGMNPVQLVFDASKAPQLDLIFAKVADVLS